MFLDLILGFLYHLIQILPYYEKYWFCFTKDYLYFCPMKKLFATDVSTLEEFDRFGYHYTKIESGENYCVWKMSTGGYELWKRKKHKNPDGTIVWAKPSDEDFGTYGWYYPTLTEKFYKKKAELIAGKEDGEEE